MESIRSKFIKVILRLIKFNSMWKLTGDKLLDYIKKRQAKEHHKPPFIIRKKYDITFENINGYYVYVMKPYNNIGDKQILYLHGGGYIYDISTLQWLFLSKLIDRLNCTITIPIYPLAPQYEYSSVFNMIVPLYEKIISKSDLKDITIMGDSAGGGLCLALVQLLREKSIMQPENIILISPALDMTLSNPEIDDVLNLDPILAPQALIEVGKLYAKGKDPKYYLISPIYGNFKNLGKISIFIGTNDIFYPDAKKMKNILENQGIKINYYEYPLMLHIWPLLFFPESKKAITEIVEIIK